MKAALTHNDIINLHDNVLSYFQEKWDKGKTYERYKKAQNWTDEEAQKIQSQNRIPYSIPVAASKINTILSTQRQNKTSFKVLAKSDPADEIKAEIAGIQLREVERDSDIQHIESEIFESGLSACYGVAEIYLEPVKDLGDIVKVRKLSYDDVIWDKNARNYDLSDALFIAKSKRMYRYELDELHPRKADELPASNDTHFGRETSEYFVTRAGHPSEENPFDIISVFTHYQKVTRTVHCVVFEDFNFFFSDNGHVYEEYDNKQDAQNLLNLIKFQYMMYYGTQLNLGQEQVNNTLKDIRDNGDVVTKRKTFIEKYVLSYDRMIEHETTKYEEFPIVVYRSFHFEDDFWVLFDYLKSGQQFIDRVISQVDYSFGKEAKTTYQLNMNLLAPGETAETAERKLTRTGGVIYARDERQAVLPVRNNPVNPQYFQMAGVMQEFIEEISGGRSYHGLSESANESGKAIVAKQQQGALVASLFLSNLVRWKKVLGKRVLMFLKKFESIKRTTKIIGDTKPELIDYLKHTGNFRASKLKQYAGYVMLPNNFLKDLDEELIVTERPLSETEKTERLAKIMALEQAYPGVVPFEVILENFDDLDYSQKQRILQNYQAIQQAQAEAGQIDADQKKAETYQTMRAAANKDAQSAAKFAQAVQTLTSNPKGDNNDKQ